MKPILSALLSNPQHPEYGGVQVSFPIPQDEYDETLQRVRRLEIGDPVLQDCLIEKVTETDFRVLHQMEGTRVSLDEVNYLALHLENFDSCEKAKFQGMAHARKLREVVDLINLAFCSCDATVITDFSDLEEVGRQHYLTTQGGCVSAQEMRSLDGVDVALQLIDSGGAVVTPYGVVYDEGMELVSAYDGRHFPRCWRLDCVLEVAVVLSPNEMDEVGAWLHLPVSEAYLERAVVRAGIAPGTDIRLFISENRLPEEACLYMKAKESLVDLNRLAYEIFPLSMSERAKLGAAIRMAKPQSAGEMAVLAHNLNLLRFACREEVSLEDMIKAPTGQVPGTQEMG